MSQFCIKNLFLPLYSSPQNNFFKPSAPLRYSLVPYKQLTLLEEKALLEIERVKQKKEERLQRKRIEENRKKIQELRKLQALKRQLEIRKVQYNVAPRNEKDVEPTLILDEGIYERAIGPIPQAEVTLHKIEEEEDRDQEALKLFLDEHRRIFRYLFSKYANSGYSAKQVTSFDTLKEKLETISLGETIKMLKDHSITLRMLTHAELASYFRLINFQTVDRHDLTALPYEGFIDLLVQLAIFIFGKEPYKMSHLTPVGLMELFVDHFRKAAKAKGETTSLYDNPKATTLGDAELIQELNRVVESNPCYPLPEGYKKIEEKYLNKNYTIPNYYKLPESLKISLELLDGILADNIGVHFLESITTHEYRGRVVPIIVKLYSRDANEKRYMMPLNKTPRKGVLAPVKKPATLKQLNTEEIKPKLTANMKLEIAKAPIQDQKDRDKKTMNLKEIISQLLQQSYTIIKKKLGIYEQYQLLLIQHQIIKFLFSKKTIKYDIKQLQIIIQNKLINIQIEIIFILNNQIAQTQDIDIQNIYSHFLLFNKITYIIMNKIYVILIRSISCY